MPQCTAPRGAVRVLRRLRVSVQRSAAACYSFTMEPAPPVLRRPDHLDAPPGSKVLPWMQAHAAGLTALVFGALAFIIVTVRQQALLAQPSWRLAVPLFVVTLVPTVVALVRREKSYALPLLGLGLATAAMFLGLFLEIVGITVIVIGVVLALSNAM